MASNPNSSNSVMTIISLTALIAMPQSMNHNCRPVFWASSASSVPIIHVRLHLEVVVSIISVVIDTSLNLVVHLHYVGTLSEPAILVDNPMLLQY